MFVLRMKLCGCDFGILVSALKAVWIESKYQDY